MKPIDWKAISQTVAAAFIYGFMSSAGVAVVTIDNVFDPHFWIFFFRGGLAAGLAAALGIMTRTFFAKPQAGETRVPFVNLADLPPLNQSPTENTK